MFDKIISGFVGGIQILSEVFNGPVSSYCRLETVDGDAIVADDGSLISVLRLEGSLKHIDATEYKRIISVLQEKLQSSFAKPGHLMQCVFEFDPDSGKARVEELFAPSCITTRNLGMELSPLFTNWTDALKRYCAVETCWLVLWTRPDVLAPRLRKIAIKECQASMGKTPSPKGCQQVSRGIASLQDAHGGFVAGVLEAFRQADLLIYLLSPKEALRDVRICIDPEFTHRHWQPLIPGDPLPLRLPDEEGSPLQHVIYPDFARQLWPREGHMVSRSAIRIGDRIYSPLIMTLMPQTPKPFAELFAALARREERLPFRASFLMGPGGLRLGLKPLLSSILAFSSADNKRFNRAVDALRELDLEGICCIKYSLCFCTWTKDADDTEAMLRLRRRSAELAKAVQGWGTADVTEAIGDPLLGFTASVPAMMPTSPAPITAAPLPDALGMLPMRPASPWREGSLLLRSRDGKIIPFAPNSAEQAAWIDLGVAPMGAGKSVFLNALNFAFVTQAGVSRLPWLSIVDVGPSSSGLITLLKESLPEGQKHLVAYHRLRMSEDFSINPFDTPLGLRRPLPAHRAFLVNFLSLLATPLDAKAPADGVPGLLQRAIELAYEYLSDENMPRKYEPSRLPELHETIVREGIKLDAHTTWWEIVDALFAKGLVHEAHQAQRYAVPLLADITAHISQNKGIQQTYPKETIQNVWRSIIDAIEAYVVLKRPTQFDLGDAQIVSLDLDEVAPRGGQTADRQSAVMYMLARHILGTRFFLMPDDVQLMPKRYQTYHAERIEAIREDPKRLCYDEAHRVTKNTSVADQLLADMSTMARESRKWNLSLGLYTQSIDDIPDIICELATTVVLLGSGTEKSANDLAKRFGLNDACKHTLLHLGKPGPAGANFIGIFRTASGLAQLALTMTIGGQPLWAFSTTTEDVTIRNGLYRCLAPSEALRRLAKRYPGGSAKADVERRKRLVVDHSSTDAALVSVTEEIIKEILEAKEA